MLQSCRGAARSGRNIVTHSRRRRPALQLDGRYPRFSLPPRTASASDRQRHRLGHAGCTRKAATHFNGQEIRQPTARGNPFSRRRRRPDRYRSRSRSHRVVLALHGKWRIVVPDTKRPHHRPDPDPDHDRNHAQQCLEADMVIDRARCLDGKPKQLVFNPWRNEYRVYRAERLRCSARSLRAVLDSYAEL